MATLAQIEKKLSSGALGGVAYQVLDEMAQGIRVKRISDGKEFFFTKEFLDNFLLRKR